jgi:hypothetical protein
VHLREIERAQPVGLSQLVDLLKSASLHTHA